MTSKALLHGAANVLLGLAAFVGISGLLRAWIPGPADFEVTAKLEHFARHAQDYDTLFIGSSVVQHQLDPAVFDARMAEHGIGVHSYNLGGSGMRGFECDHVLRRALATPGQRLRFVVIEAPTWNPVLYGRNAQSARVVEWHTPLETWSAIDSSLHLGLAWPERLQLAFTHLRLFGWWLGNYGQASRALADAPDPRSPFGQPVVEAARGYLALEDWHSPDVETRRASLLDDPESFLRRVEDVRREQADRGAGQWYNVAATRRQERAVRAAGAEPIYVVPPSTMPAPLALRGQDLGCLEGLVFLNDPDATPQFFTPQSHFDNNHLGRDAARELSRLFADEVAQRVGATGD